MADEAVELDPVKHSPPMTFTDGPMPRFMAFDSRIHEIDWFKYALERAVKFERARRNPMLALRGDEGKPLYRLTSGGNLIRTMPLSKTRKRAVVARDKGTCIQCGSKGALEVDHIKRYVDGGGNEMSNLRTLCHTCHGKRGGRP